MTARVRTSGGAALPEVMLGIGIIAMAGLAAWQASQIRVSPLYAKVGPTIFPYIAATLLAILGCLLVWQGLKGGWQPDDEKEVPVDWRALGVTFAGMVANALLIGPLGFTLASTVMFALIAWGFGSRTPWIDAPIGFVLALLAYFGFAGALGVNIGMGPFERMLGTMIGM